MERIGSQFGEIRREWLFAPAAPGAPLVVFLTGTGGTAAWADRETGWSKLAAAQGFALAVPEALPPNPLVPVSFLHNPPRWNDGSAPLFDSHEPDDVGFLTHVIADAIQRYEVDPRRVFVTGFSNGAGMTFRFAAERASVVAAIAPVAGHLWADAVPACPVPTLYTVGTRDLLIPLRGGEVSSPWTNRLVRRPPVAETLERWAAAIGCSPLSVAQTDSGTVSVVRYPGPVVFDAVTVEGLGHHWPGGRAQLNPRTAGPPSAAIDATTMIWEFFRGVRDSMAGQNRSRPT